jgi:hypothetical protein
MPGVETDCLAAAFYLDIMELFVKVEGSGGVSPSENVEYSTRNNK